ncbi:MAG: hypothetical protein MJ110_02970 [Lachnospiraceae bacterium]|nr:hypothetical protein [Lachnospiraceae bacterium]
MKDNVSRINITTNQDIEIKTKKKTMECKKSLPSLKYIELMGIYLNEINRRDTNLWKQLYTLFLSILVFELFPYMNKFWKIENFPSVPAWLFPLVASVLIVVFWIVGVAYAIRVSAVSATYGEMIKNIKDESCRRKTVTEIAKERNMSKGFQGILNIHMTELIVHTMTGCLLILNIISWIDVLKTV